MKLRDLLTLGAIIPSLPNNIANGTPIDALPVMQNFNAIVAAVNANAAPLSSLPVFTGITAFTPRLAFGGSSAGITYVIQAGAYCKLSNVIFFSIDLALSSKGAAAGVATIEDLPFAAGSSFPTGSAPIVGVLPRNVTFASGYLMGLLSSTRISLLNAVTASSFSPVDNTTCANNSEFIITGFYST